MQRYELWEAALIDPRLRPRLLVDFERLDSAIAAERPKFFAGLERSISAKQVLACFGGVGVCRSTGTPTACHVGLGGAALICTLLHMTGALQDKSMKHLE